MTGGSPASGDPEAAVTWSDALTLATRLGVAALGGLAVGIEREWSARARARPARFAGVRTFLLLGLLGALATTLFDHAGPPVGLVVLAAAAGLVVGAYVVTARGGDVDGTTEVSALVVLGAGALAGSGHLALASGLAALTALVLVEKSRIHGLVHRLRSETIEAAARFAVLALVVLPLLPEGPLGPAPGVRPRELWALVLLFSGLSFGGYLALRLVGADRGYAVAGVLGGLVSSTAVTLSFSRESRGETAPGRALGTGVIGACTVLLIRVGVLGTALNPAVGWRLVPYLLLPLVVGLGSAMVARRWGTSHTGATLPGNPLRLGAAIQMALAFQAVLYVVEWLRRWLGSPGVLLSAAGLGLTDVDALTYALTRSAVDGSDVATAAQALAVGVLANTLLKLTLALVIGRGAFRRTAGAGLAALAIGSLGALLGLRPGP
jgi:uncharacterized membrane protein (DUF4010 family)